jgi:sulfur carrier protein
MEITVNNQSKQISESCTIQQLLNEVVGNKQKGIAVAVNQTVISKQKWSDFYLKQNDSVLIIKATQGG